MHRLGVPFASVLALAASLSLAPFQCAHDPDPSRRMEDEPGQALYDLAGELHGAGDEVGRIRTLQYIVKRYPATRWAAMASKDLEDAHVAAGAGSP